MGLEIFTSKTKALSAQEEMFDVVEPTSCELTKLCLHLPGLAFTCQVWFDSFANFCVYLPTKNRENFQLTNICPPKNPLQSPHNNPLASPHIRLQITKEVRSQRLCVRHHSAGLSTKREQRIKIGFGINVKITDSSPLPIPDWQSKMLTPTTFNIKRRYLCSRCKLLFE